MDGELVNDPVIKELAELPLQEVESLLLKSLNYYKKDWDSKVGIPVIGKFMPQIGYKDKPNVDQNGKPISRRTTALHLLARRKLPIVSTTVRELFVNVYNKFDLNYTDELGLTHFQLACEYGCNGVIEKFLDLEPNPNYPTRGMPLNMALAWCRDETAEALLKSGADPNAADEDGITPLHIISQKKYDNNLAEMLFEISDELNRLVQVDAQDKWGNTPLHLAVTNHNRKLINLLLRRGSDPNRTNDKKESPLHLICEIKEDLQILYDFFEINKEKHRTIVVDAQDNLGNRPLHWALRHGNIMAADLLLSRGADPNLVNAKGMTPLHMICKMDIDVPYLAKLLFQIGREKFQPVKVDAKDKQGQTPLQWAVASLLPDMVDMLLDDGADLSSFIFPSEICLEAECFLSWKLRKASVALCIVERLERSGYELARSDAQTIMKIFSKNMEDYEKRLSDDEEYTIRAKKIMIIPNLSLQDLFGLPFNEAAKLLKYQDFLEFARTNELDNFPTRLVGEACAERLCEIMLKGFFRVWALDPFWKLTGYRLPLEICEMIIDGLMNQDLYHICLAATSQSS